MNIKKLSFKFVAMLFMELLIVGGIINVFFYNNVFREYVVNNFFVDNVNMFYDVPFNNSSLTLNMYIILIILFVIPGIFNYVFMKLFQIISKKDIIFDSTDNENAINNKKVKYTYAIINIISNIILIVILFINANKFSNDLTSIINNNLNDDEFESFITVNGFISIPNIFINSLLYSTIPLLLGIIPLSNLFKDKGKERKYKNVINFAIAFLGLVIGIYYYIDIPEFKYRYEIYEDKVYVYEYVDNRDIIYSEKLIYPQKVWNKKVTGSNYRTIFSVFTKYKWKIKRV